ncbi:hypothetical protein K458DRAFT_414498 [Lentithecium fluviatile CBS 122367]|uniref:C3H1-type domain-containing protein n=1 Tax=Lentithecium fluviatile CBS 122367 TaxID=1168545 RepID=A0A6G1JF00_9PLEO|nr:hypothetical protein K458DRAFT_414498 [Lentithecium fluviatile CBS 122367]
MATDFNTTDFVSQMRGFQASDEARQKLFAHMLEQYTLLLEEHSNLKNDYTSERDIRRNYQKAVDQMQRQVAETHRELENNSFVLALIDGDGVIFQDALLSAAANDGGSEAASRLQHAIRAHIASLYSNSGNWPILVHIYLSLDKLAQKLASVGMLSHPQQLRTFAQGFSVNQPLFSIIDVGHGKERADHKIKEMLRTFSDNPTCKHIIFGGCHDAGYLLNLDQYKHHANKAARITLLESTPAYRGFTDLPNFQRTRFDSVFKNAPLPDFYPQQQYTQAPVQTPVQPTAPATFQPLKRALTNGSPAPTPPPVSATPAASSPSTTVSSLAYPTPESEASWATVGKAGVSPNENISIAPKTNPKKKWAYYNKEGQRLDEALPLRDQAAAQAIDQRMKKAGRNLCNHWHLNKGKCHNKESCKFQHEPKLTPAGTIALRYKTRSLACKDRYCENIDCYLGHQCTFERDQGSCPYPDTCNLAHTHGMDKQKFSRWDEQGNEQTLG